MTFSLEDIPGVPFLGYLSLATANYTAASGTFNTELLVRIPIYKDGGSTNYTLAANEQIILTAVSMYGPTALTGAIIYDGSDFTMDPQDEKFTMRSNATVAFIRHSGLYIPFTPGTHPKLRSTIINISGIICLYGSIATT